MEDKCVSIILPVYNAVNYIEKTITSVLNQTYKNFELIIVDDGATDGTSEICRNYAQKDYRISYYKQNNFGTAVARNRGIELAKGEYIAFLDHDDEYLPHFLEELLEISEEDDELIKCGVIFREEYINGKASERKDVFYNEKLSQKDLLDDFCNLPIAFFGVWNALYKLETIKNSGVRFPVDMRHGEEDYYFNTALIPYITNVKFSSKCMYKHYRRLNQSTSAKYYDDRIDAMLKQYEMEINMFKKSYKGSKNIKSIEAILYSRKVVGIISYCYSTLKTDVFNKCIENIEQLNEKVKNLEADSSEKFRLSELPIKYRIIYFLTVHRFYVVLIGLWTLKNRR